MRSYGQYCAIAKSLDVLGDRWTLLIVRELLLVDALGSPQGLRYTDLRAALPGIATNLLAERLRELEQAGVIERLDAPPPVATALYSVTDRGRELRTVLDALGQWGVRYMSDGPAPGDVFRGEWLAWPAEQFLTDTTPRETPVTLAVSVAGDALVLETRDGAVRSRAPRPGEQPDAELEGVPHAILGLLSGNLDLDAARARGVRYEGDPTVLARMQPAALAAASAR